MKDEINKVIDELQESVRFFIEVRARVTIDLPQYRHFYDAIQRFIGKHDLENTDEWKELDRWLIRKSREHMTPKEAVAIQRALEGLRRKAINVSKANPVEPKDYWTYVHPAIRQVSKTPMDSGLFAEAVEDAFKEVNVQVKRKTGSDKDGKDLMNWAFSPKNPVLKVESDVDTRSGQDSQLGYMNLFSGAISAIRNPKAHENMVISREDALRKLYFASMLMFKLDAANLAHPQHPPSQPLTSRPPTSNLQPLTSRPPTSNLQPLTSNL